MTEIELKLKVKAVFEAGNEVSNALSALVGKEPTSLVAAHVFMANQHLQDALNRVSNIAALLRQSTDEGITEAVDDAAAKGKLTVLPPTTPPAAATGG